MKFSSWQVYGKSIIAFVFFLWTVVAPLLTGDQRISGWEEWTIIIMGGANGVLVYFIPMNPKWEAGKTVINGVLAACAAAQTVLGDGFQYNDLTIIVGAFLALVIGWYAPAITNPQSQVPGARVVVPSGFNA